MRFYFVAPPPSYFDREDTESDHREWFSSERAAYNAYKLWAQTLASVAAHEHRTFDLEYGYVDIKPSMTGILAALNSGISDNKTIIDNQTI